MDAKLSNFEVLDGLLCYLQQEEMLGSVIGRSKATIMSVLYRNSLIDKCDNWLLECPLLGEPGTDIGLRFNTKNFFEGNFLTGAAERYNRFFEVYARTVGSQKEFILELDTAAGSGGQMAVYLDIQERPQQAIGKALASQGETRRMAAVEKLLAYTEELRPTQFCFVYARTNLPLRFTFKAKEPHTMEAIIRFIEKIEQAHQSKVLQKALEKNEQLKDLQVNSPMLQDLYALAKLDIFDCSLTVDLFPDGHLGPIMGIDLELRAGTVAEQEAVLGSEQFAKLYELLVKGKVMDARFNCINKSIFAVPLPKETGPQEYLTSLLAGFKLRYKQGKRLPAKIFFQGSRG